MAHCFGARRWSRFTGFGTESIGNVIFTYCKRVAKLEDYKVYRLLRQARCSILRATVKNWHVLEKKLKPEAM
jgi:hypothetical protein